MKNENICKKCGSTNTYWKEEHADSGMDEVVLACRDCVKSKTIMLPPFRFRMKEKVKTYFRNNWSKHVIPRLFRLARWSTKYGRGYCSWCGSKPGFDSVYSVKGLRCNSYKRDCTGYR